MGTLKPGASYVYEKAMGVTYAREVGAHPGDRCEIGRDYDPNAEPTVFGMPIKQLAPWVDILQQAEHNPTLQDALDRVKILYELSRDHNASESIMWHPV